MYNDFKNDFISDLAQMDINLNKQQMSKILAVLDGTANKYDILNRNNRIKIMNEQEGMINNIENSEMNNNINSSERTNLIKDDRIFLLTNGDKLVMPDITGYSKIEVKTLANFMNLSLKTAGNGYAISQSIKKDEIIQEEDKILEVEFKLPY